MNKLLVICGPTATGKTDLAVTLAKIHDAELISADSRQVFRGMDIGTGKDLPSKEYIKKLLVEVYFRQQKYSLVPYRFYDVPLWMVDVVNPNNEFSVSHYHALASAVIADIQKSKKLPIVVGGTGLYISSLLDPPETMNIPPNNELRKKLSALSIDKLQLLLKKEYPHAWETLNESDRANSRRLVRQLEIGDFKRNEKKVPVKQKNAMYDTLVIGLYADNKELQEKISARVDKRVQQGIIREVNELVKQGYGWEVRAMSGLGYKEWKPLFEKNNQTHLSKEKLVQEIISQWKTHEFQYAKRQMTWFRKMNSISWFDVSNASEYARIDTVVKAWYQR